MATSFRPTDVVPRHPVGKTVALAVRQHKLIFAHQAAKERALPGRDHEQDAKNGRFHSKAPSWAYGAFRLTQLFFPRLP